jgi:hypothetical protein
MSVMWMIRPLGTSASDAVALSRCWRAWRSRPHFRSRRHRKQQGITRRHCRPATQVCSSATAALAAQLRRALAGTGRPVGSPVATATTCTAAATTWTLPGTINTSTQFARAEPSGVPARVSRVETSAPVARRVGRWRGDRRHGANRRRSQCGTHRVAHAQQCAGRPTAADPALRTERDLRDRAPRRVSGKDWKLAGASASVHERGGQRCRAEWLGPWDARGRDRTHDTRRRGDTLCRCWPAHRRGAPGRPSAGAAPMRSRDASELASAGTASGGNQERSGAWQWRDHTFGVLVLVCDSAERFVVRRSTCRRGCLWDVRIDARHECLDMDRPDRTRPPYWRGSTRHRAQDSQLESLRKSCFHRATHGRRYCCTGVGRLLTRFMCHVIVASGGVGTHRRHRCVSCTRRGLGVTAGRASDVLLITEPFVSGVVLNS